MFDLSRRRFLRAGAVSVGVGVSGWLDRLAAAAGPKPKRSCVLLWMSGGPATIDLFDLKPGHANGGPSKETATAAPGLRWTEHLPKLADHAKDLAVLRGMSTKEGDHGLATYVMRTGNRPQGAIEFPTVGALVAKELADPAADLPPFVSVAPQRALAANAFGPGFLGPKFGPLMVADGQGSAPAADADRRLRVENLSPFAGVSGPQADDRLALMRDLEAPFLTARPGTTTDAHRAAFAAAVRLMKPETARAFDLGDEPDAVRDRYGRTLFGQGCLLARRLVERGVPFVEVTLDGWDTHGQNFDAVKTLCGTLDPAWSALMADLKDRGLLGSTTVVWMGEFGRTPKINRQTGRDHFPDAWAAVLGGAGIKGGQAVGKTGKDGMKVEDRPVSAPDLLATLFKAVGIDTETQNLSNVGRPIPVVDKAAAPVAEVLL
ncbi:MAG: DUF1501 domain-containing protein [Gemmataceae bacterium]|nr:DUF1501 domain-containing protein [Gemmataceae bacterium]